MKVLITGANGFVGSNLAIHLGERNDIEVFRFTRSDNLDRLSQLIKQVDFVFHLAGVNRPIREKEFKEGNTDLTQALCEAISISGKLIPVLYTSSIQADNDNPYGVSKRKAEEVLIQFSKRHGSPVHLFRLPNVFGKWARANYNSAVATFCHNIARDLPIEINDPDANVQLVYIDNVIDRFINVLDGNVSGNPFVTIEPMYKATVGELAKQIKAFRDSRSNLVTESVGTDFTRALYSTYVSYIPVELFHYEIPKYADARGEFAEVLKTKNSGQFSFFTAHPGVTRGGHYHHSKTEKFLVIRGQARFGFLHVVTGETYELHTSSERLEIVETVPGWAHDITNTGDDEMVVMLWANEIFDRAYPDTYSSKV